MAESLMTDQPSHQISGSVVWSQHFLFAISKSLIVVFPDAIPAVGKTPTLQRFKSNSLEVKHKLGHRLWLASNKDCQYIAAGLHLPLHLHHG